MSYFHANPAMAGINTTVRGKAEVAKQFAELGALTPDTLRRYAEEISKHPYAPESLKAAARTVMECYVCSRKEVYSESDRNRLRVCGDCKRRYSHVGNGR